MEQSTSTNCKRFPRFIAHGYSYYKFISQEECIEVTLNDYTGESSISIYHQQHFAYDLIHQGGSRISELTFTQNMMAASLQIMKCVVAQEVKEEEVLHELVS